ncbi:hypothetical protein CDO46_07150 [Pigmentiphaga sp. NML030171]|nr:hypothetical protein CDO46_07150 [Pigmentiphaga sp. NML030171]
MASLQLDHLPLEPNAATLLGAAAAMSSTALVSRKLADQGELTTRHGRSAIAVLVFQDLASVPLLPHPQSASRIVRAVRQHHPALPVVVVCWRESEALVLKELPNVHVYKAAIAPALGLAEQVMQLGGIPVTAANGALSSMRNATTL